MIVHLVKITKQLPIIGHKFVLTFRKSIHIRIQRKKESLM